MEFTIEKINSFDSGYILTKKELDTINKDKLIKINLPDTRAESKLGNGEGCFAILNNSDYLDYTNNKNFGEFKAILLNSSIYYPLEVGTIVPCNHNGIHRPSVDYDWLQSIVK